MGRRAARGLGRASAGAFWQVCPKEMVGRARPTRSTTPRRWRRRSRRRSAVALSHCAISAPVSVLDSGVSSCVSCPLALALSAIASARRRAVRAEADVARKLNDSGRAGRPRRRAQRACRDRARHPRRPAGALQSTTCDPATRCATSSAATIRQFEARLHDDARRAIGDRRRGRAATAAAIVGRTAAAPPTACAPRSRRWRACATCVFGRSLEPLSDRSCRVEAE